MRIYLSGPMRSQPDHGRAAFGRAADALRGQGHHLYVPTEQPGADACDIWDVRAALAANLDWVCLHADGVVVLPGWRSSRGARAEVCTALALDLPVWPVDAFLLSGPEAIQLHRVGMGVTLR